MALLGITHIILHNMLVSPTENPICLISHTNIAIGGLVGPMIIHGPSNAPCDIDLGPVFLTDYYHQDYFSIIESVMGGTGVSNPRPMSDNNLINGKMTFNCSSKAAGDNTPCSDNASVSKFKFQTGKTHRLRLINAGAEGMQRFSIDGHKMVVIANDFVPVVSTPATNRFHHQKLY